MILDEATASVDADNESYIQKAISELCKGKTLLVIAHRLNTIQNADQILVIDQGRLPPAAGRRSCLTPAPCTGLCGSSIKARRFCRKGGQLNVPYHQTDLDIAGDQKKYIYAGIVCNILKTFSMAMMLMAVYVVISHLDSLTAEVIGQGLGILIASVFGRFLFQWLEDISMSAKGFDIFRDYRLLSVRR